MTHEGRQRALGATAEIGCTLRPGQAGHGCCSAQAASILAGTKDVTASQQVQLHGSCKRPAFQATPDAPCAPLRATKMQPCLRTASRGKHGRALTSSRALWRPARALNPTGILSQKSGFFLQHLCLLSHVSGPGPLHLGLQWLALLGMLFSAPLQHFCFIDVGQCLLLQRLYIVYPAWRMQWPSRLCRQDAPGVRDSSRP